MLLCCNKPRIQKPANTPAESCWSWQPSDTIIFKLPRQAFIEYYDTVFVKGNEPPTSQFGPRLLDKRMDGYKIARSDVFQGKLFKPNDIICQINNFNLITSCPDINNIYDKKCWDEESSTEFEKMRSLATQPEKMIGAEAELRIFRNGIPIKLIIRIVP